MKSRIGKLKRRLDLIGAAVLAVGGLCSLLIYLDADELAADAVLGNQLDESKQYVRALELYGGKANLLATELSQWFYNLWHGKELAYTVAMISLVVSLSLFFLDYYLDPESDTWNRT